MARRDADQEFVLKTEEVACDLCGASPSESLPLYEALSDVRYKVPGKFVLRRCLRCGLMYLSPRPTPDTIAAYYPSDYSAYKQAVEDERLAIMRWMRRRKLTRMRRQIERFSSQKRGRVLDVGCATGLFLHEMAQAGWQAAGVEPIPSAAAYARQRFGLDVFQGTLGEAPYAPASFDVVTFWDVLEHTFSPSSEVGHAARLLRPGGLLAFNVPNWDSLDRRIFDRHWVGLDPPRHLYVFTRDTLTTLLARTGFSVLDWVCFMAGYFSFILGVQAWLETVNPRVSRTVMRVLNFPGMRLPFEPWFTITNWLGKGANLTVFARKQG